jgi:hypothetical protein
MVYANSGVLKFCININSNHAGSKIVKVEPFGFIGIFDKNAFFVVNIKFDTLLFEDVDESHTTIHLKMVQLKGFAKRGLVWVTP